MQLTVKGGYRGKHQLTALKNCCLFAVAGTVFAIMLGYVYDPVQFTFVWWMLLFWGGCMIPTATGIVVSSVPKS
jgi:MFS family permease